MHVLITLFNVYIDNQKQFVFGIDFFHYLRTTKLKHLYIGKNENTSDKIYRKIFYS